MATRRNDKSPSVLVWVILLSSATTNQADVMSDADCTLNVQGIIISTLPSSLSVASLQKTCGLKKRRIYVDTTDINTMKCKQFIAITWTAFESSIWLAYIYWRVVYGWELRASVSMCFNPYGPSLASWSHTRHSHTWPKHCHIGGTHQHTPSTFPYGLGSLLLNIYHPYDTND